MGGQFFFNKNLKKKKKLGFAPSPKKNFPKKKNHLVGGPRGFKGFFPPPPGQKKGKKNKLPRPPPPPPRKKKKTGKKKNPKAFVKPKFLGGGGKLWGFLVKNK